MIPAVSEFLVTYREPLLWAIGGLGVVVVLGFVSAAQRWMRQVKKGPRRGEPLLDRRYPRGALTALAAMPVLMFLAAVVLNAPHEVPLGRPGAVLFAAVFGLLWVALLIWGLRALWRGRLETHVLRLEEADVGPRGRVTGRYRLPARRWDGQPVHLRLVLQEFQVIERPTGRGGRWTGFMVKPLWSTDAAIRPRRVGRHVEIPFAFRLPRRIPQARQGRMEWILILEGGSLGIHSHAVWSGPPKALDYRAPPREAGDSIQEGRRGASAAIQALDRAQNPFGTGMVMQAVALLFLLGLPWIWLSAMDAAGGRPWAHLGRLLPPALWAGGLLIGVGLSGWLALTASAAPSLGSARNARHGWQWIQAAEGVASRKRRARRRRALGVFVLTSIWAAAGSVWGVVHGLPEAWVYANGRVDTTAVLVSTIAGALFWLQVYLAVYWLGQLARRLGWVGAT